MQIWKNSFFVFLSLVIRAVTNFLIGVGIFRFYGVEAFGQFSIAFTVANICLIVADFGFDVLLTTEIANSRKNAGEIGRKYYSIKMVLALIASLIMISIPGFLPLSATSKSLIVVLVLYMIFTTISNFFFAFFRGFEKFEFETRISFLSNLILLVSIAVFGFLKFHLIYLMMVFVFTRFLSILIAAPTASKLAGMNVLKLDFSESSLLMKKVLVFGLSFLFGNLFFQLDTLLIGVWLGDIAAGIYRSAFYIMIMLLMIPDIAISSALPILSRAYLEDLESWRKYSRMIFKFLLILVLPITIVMYFYPHIILYIIYGKIKSPEAITILKIFSIVLLIRFIVEPFGLLLTTSKRQHFRMIIVFSATVISFVLNYIFVPTHGLLSVAYIALIVNAFVGLAYIVFNKMLFLKWILEWRNIAVMALSICIGLILWKSNASYYSLIPSIISYPLFIYFIGFSSQERNVIIASLPFRKSLTAG